MSTDEERVSRQIDALTERETQRENTARWNDEWTTPTVLHRVAHRPGCTTPVTGCACPAVVARWAR